MNKGIVPRANFSEESLRTKMSSSNRDRYDEAIKNRETNFLKRHRRQLREARVAEENDRTWTTDRNELKNLNTQIDIRKSNYDTYMNSMNIEKTLYNRERHRTLLLGVANVFALAGCVAMWSF